MEFLIILTIIFAYSSLSSKINEIANNMPKKDKKSFPSLKELIGKNIEIETDDYIDSSIGDKPKGILKDYNDTWILIETIGKKKELYYYRLNNITSIDIIDK